MKISALMGSVSIISSMGLVAEAANEWQAFFGILFAAGTLAVYAWRTYVITNNERKPPDIGKKQ